MSVTVKQLHEEWFKVALIRGIPLLYKGKDMLFPTVYMRESHMEDQEVFDKVDGEDLKQSNDASKKLFTFVTRVIANEGFLYEDRDALEAIGKADRKIKPLERKFKALDKEDEKYLEKRTEIEALIKELRTGLKHPQPPVNIEDGTILMFPVESFKINKTRTIDFVRLAKAFKEINLLEEESLDNFLTLPGV